MKYGFIIVAAAAPQIAVADCLKNAQSIIGTVNELKESNAELILFPELSLTSCSCGDLFTQPHFIHTCKLAIEPCSKPLHLLACEILRVGVKLL